MQKPFTHLAVFVLALAALLQLVRFLLGWDVVIQGHSIPVWASGVAFIVAGGLALALWQENRKSP